MQKDQEEYVRDLQLKEQEKLANKNDQRVSSTTIRTYRKRQRNFTVLDANSEFNQYPSLNNYKFKTPDEEDYDVNELTDENTVSKPTSSGYSNAVLPKNPGFLSARTRNRGDRFLDTMTARNTQRTNLHQLLISRQRMQTQKAIAVKVARMKKESELAKARYQQKQVFSILNPNVKLPL